jgi:hypothetical protein
MAAMKHGAKLRDEEQRSMGVAMQRNMHGQTIIGSGLLA